MVRAVHLYKNGEKLYLEGDTAALCKVQADAMESDEEKVLFVSI